MRSMTGVVIIVQEGRFQLLDDEGVSHQFVLQYGASVEPEQLPSLLERRIHVAYMDSDNLIGHVAKRLSLLETP